jgi:hypothetical protein
MLLAALLVVPAVAGAQGGRRTSLTMTGWPLTLASTSGNDFEAGFVMLGSTTFTVDATSNSGSQFPNRSTTVEVQCAGGCPESGSLSVGDVQWRRADQVAWTSLTTNFVAIEQRDLVFDGVNDPWGQSMQWRYLLSWTGSPPTAASQFRVRFRLLVTAP